MAAIAFMDKLVLVDTHANPDTGPRPIYVAVVTYSSDVATRLIFLNGYSRQMDLDIWYNIF